MKQIVSGLIAGLLFGIGLAVSEMMNPAKVVGFLDIFGVWDPTLAFVMGGALLITAPGFWLARKRQRSILGASFHIPTRKDIDTRLLLGASLFGVGWGLAGFCPGPALAALSTAMPDVFLFVGSMLAGMLLFKLTSRR
jgi:uncharacterized membrane protein YedE/YeeE